ncbi:hypothetical protein ACHAXR_008813 [Thalassiosira sp. AJA248-18]
MNKSLVRPSSTASFASAASTTSKDNDKPRILCLHGAYQSGAIFSNKIAGARRKISREYELDFLDGPILLPQNEEDGNIANNDTDIDLSMAPRSWWRRSEDGKHTLVREAFDYVIQQTETVNYDAIIGFSQGGTLATALALSGALPTVRAVVTAGAPFNAKAFEVASESSFSNGFDIPKLHLAGETDALVAVESTMELTEKFGGKLIVHEQGHLFPTRSARVREVLDFLGTALSEK